MLNLLTVAVESLYEDLGEHKVLYKEITGPASYNTTDKFVPQIVELKGIERIIAIPISGHIDTANNKMIVPEITDDNKIVFYELSGSGISEVADGTDLSGVKLGLIVVGW